MPVSMETCKYSYVYLIFSLNNPKTKLKAQE